MHARNRTWLLGSDPAERCRQRTMPVEGGDGSTLSLDFTTGVLDPRLTFTRTGNSTFINSSGLVQWADSNMLRNSSWSDANTPPTNWGAGLNGSGAVTIPSTGVRTCAVTTSGWSYLYDGGLSLAGGINYMASFDVTAATGSPTIGTIVSATSGSSNFVYYVDGTKVTSSYAITAACNVTMLFLAGSGGALVRQGIGADGVAVTNKSLSMTNPRVCPSQIPASSAPATITVPTYYQSVSTSAGYYAPRFEYDPTTPAPSGLLIEGSATNELSWSNKFSTSPWATLNFNTPSIASPAVTDPAGGTDTWYGVPSGTGYHGFRQTFTFTDAAYTFSIWAKAAEHDKFIISNLTNGTGACRFDLTAKTATIITGTGTPTNPQIVPYPNGWFRCSFTMQMSVASAGIGWSSYPNGAAINQYGAQFTATGTDGMYFYGAQMELGSGASSYIPTGASTASRAADVCYMTGQNFSSWFTQGAGTIVAQSDIVKANTRNLIGQISNAGTTYIQMGSKALAGGGEAIGYLLSGSIEGFADSNNNPSLNTAYKSAYAWDTNYFNVCVNGTLATADTSGNIASSGMTQMCIGADHTVPTDIYIKNGHIKSLKYWPYRLNNAQIQALTT